MGLLGNIIQPAGPLLGNDPQAEARRLAIFNGLAEAGFTLMGDKNLGNAGGAFLRGVRSGYQKPGAATSPRTVPVYDPATGRYVQMQWVNGQWTPIEPPALEAEGTPVPMGTQTQAPAPQSDGPSRGRGRFGGQMPPESAYGGGVIKAQYAPTPEETEAEAAGMPPQQWGIMRQHPLLGDTYGPQDHDIIDHAMDGTLPGRQYPGTDAYEERFHGDDPGSYDMSPPEPFVPRPTPRPDWGVPGTDMYYQNRDGQEVDLTPVPDGGPPAGPVIRGSYSPQEDKGEFIMAADRRPRTPRIKTDPRVRRSPKIPIGGYPESNPAYELFEALGGATDYRKPVIKTDPRVRGGKNKVPIGRYPNVMDSGADPGYEDGWAGFEPMSFSPVQGGGGTRSAPGRFGGSIPQFGSQAIRTASEAPAKKEPAPASGKPEKLTEGQSKDVVFYNRAIYANDDLTNLETALQQQPDAALGDLPVIGGAFKSPDYRQAERAAREFLAVVLRKDTGAQVTNQELAMYTPMYIPTYWDDPQTLADKRDARERFLQGMYLAAGSSQPIFDQINSEYSSRDKAKALKNKYGLE